MLPKVFTTMEQNQEKKNLFLSITPKKLSEMSKLCNLPSHCPWEQLPGGDQYRSHGCV